jgi:hypothetical protein
MTKSFKLSLFLKISHRKSLCTSRLHLRMPYSFFLMCVILYTLHKQAAIHQSFLNLTIGNKDGINVYEILVPSLFVGSLIMHDIWICEGGPKNNWNLNVARELEVVARCAARCHESRQYSSSLSPGVDLGWMLLLLWLFFKCLLGGLEIFMMADNTEKRGRVKFCFLLGTDRNLTAAL